MTRGRFITLEGGEGAGKTTQRGRLCAALAARFQVNGRPLAVLPTREPGGSPGAESIRELLVCGSEERWDDRTEALLHTAARRDHLLRTILPALSRGQWVVCDRFVDSTIAYQGYGHGLERGSLLALHRFACDGLLPDLTFLLDLPVSCGLARTLERERGAPAPPKSGAPGQGRGLSSPAGVENRYEQLDETFHQRVRDGFLAIARAEPARVRVVDARQDEESLLNTLLDQIREAFPELEDVDPGP